mgnify:CR=1 FL=1
MAFDLGKERIERGGDEFRRLGRHEVAGLQLLEAAVGDGSRQRLDGGWRAEQVVRTRQEEDRDAEARDLAGTLVLVGVPNPELIMSARPLSATELPITRLS